jgi:hypothetical protein
MNPARLRLRDHFGTGITSADLRHRRRPAAHSGVQRVTASRRYRRRLQLRSTPCGPISCPAGSSPTTS